MTKSEIEIIGAHTTAWKELKEKRENERAMWSLIKNSLIAIGILVACMGNLPEVICNHMGW